MERGDDWQQIRSWFFVKLMAVLAACGGGTESPPITQPPTVPQSGTPLPAGPFPSPSQPGGTPQPPTSTPELPLPYPTPTTTPSGTPTPTPTPTDLGDFIEPMAQAVYDTYIALRDHDGWWHSNQGVVGP